MRTVVALALVGLMGLAACGPKAQTTPTGTTGAAQANPTPPPAPPPGAPPP